MSDIDSIDNIIHALYDVISEPAGTKRDWDRDRNLFYPNARLVRTTIDEDGAPKATSMDIETYVTNVEEMLKDQGFFEQEIARETKQFGNFAQVLSSYEARYDPDDTTPFKRGVNGIQLYNDGDRWWVMHMIWDDERPGVELPANLRK